MTDELAVVVSNGRGVALGAYQSRDDVRELGDRLMAMHPAAEDVGVRGMRAAAQLALMLGANPLPGANELHIWKDKNGKTCVTLGIGFWRRKADELGGVLFEQEPHPMRSDDLATYGIQNGQIAAVARGCRASDMLRFRQLGFKTNEIWDMCGRTGVGVMNPNEYAKSGRPQMWTALKRAESDLLRQLFPAEFGRIETRAAVELDAPIVVSSDDTEPDEFVDGEIEDAGGELEGHAPVAPPSQDAETATDDGPPPDDELVISEATVAAFIDTVAALTDSDADAVKARFRELGYAGVPATAEQRLRMYRAFKEGKKSGLARLNEELF